MCILVRLKLCKTQIYICIAAMLSEDQTLNLWIGPELFWPVMTRKKIVVVDQASLNDAFLKHSCIWRSMKEYEVVSKSSRVKGGSLAKLCPFLDKLVDLSPQAEINSTQLKTAVMSTLVKDPSLNSTKIKNDVWACCRVDRVITALNHLTRLIDPERWLQCCSTSSGESAAKLKKLLVKVKPDFGSDAQPISPQHVPLPYLKEDPEPSSEHDKVEEENKGQEHAEPVDKDDDENTGQELAEPVDKDDDELTPAKPPKRLRSKMSAEELQELFFSPAPATPTTKTTINSISSTIKAKASSGSAGSKESSGSAGSKASGGSASSSSSNEKVVYRKEYYSALNKYGFKKTLPGQKPKHIFCLSGGLWSKEQLTALADKVLKDLRNCRNEAEENEVELIAKFKLQA
jgi:hypothetical protein